MLIDNPSPFFWSVLVCPISKEPLRDLKAPCGFSYRDGDLRVGLDFASDWAASQARFEAWQRAFFSRNETIPSYYTEVDESMMEVYDAIPMSGKVLDVAGGLGTVVKQADLDPSTYISVDAFPFLWRNFTQHRKLAEHYAVCANLCRVPAFAEFLPIASGAMDVVHMRSCLDHFSNPLLALKEAFRVLKSGGQLVVGISLEGAYKKSNRTARDRLKAFVKRNYITRELYERLFDHHIFHPTHKSVLDLVARAGFVPHKEHWEAAYHGVLYLVAKKARAHDCFTKPRF